MREILFRGKRIDNGEWVYGCYVNQLNKPIIFEKETEWHHYVDENTLGQFTGLKDKNGTNIFEGDIVEFESHGYIPSTYKGVVVFHEGSYCIEWKSKYFGDTGFHRIGEVDEWQDMSASGKITYTYEVIGNIYDNPELLEV